MLPRTTRSFSGGTSPDKKSSKVNPSSSFSKRRLDFVGWAAGGVGLTVAKALVAVEGTAARERMRDAEGSFTMAGKRVGFEKGE